VFAIPGFNLKTLSDDELFKKQAELLKKISWAQRHSSMGQGAQQMSAMLSLIETERSERMFMARWNMVEDYISEPIETDPTLRDLARAIKEKNKPPEKSISRPRPEKRLVPVPTKHPVVVRTEPINKDNDG
jgi:hypothetical protein